MLARMAGDIGLKARCTSMSLPGLMRQQGVYPILVRLKNGRSIILVGVKAEENGERKLAVIDPLAAQSNVQLLDPQQFAAHWSGDVILLKREYKLTDINQPFGFRWFIPEILKQKAAFRDIFIAALAMQLLGLATPIFFQLVLDRVLSHQAETTLWVLAAGISFAILFEAGFGFMRQMLTITVGNKIDIRLTRRMFAHLLSLPIDYFETTSAGVIARHVQQLEKIRNFLTGRLFMTGIDVISLVVFIPVLFFYSFQLALIVLFFTLIICLLIFTLLPAYTQRLSDLYAAEGERQAMLVESVHGMRTLKSLAIEPIQRKLWDQRSAQSINMHFKVGQIGILGNSITDLIGKFLPIVIIVVGAQMVFDNTMTVGALIAFQMMSGRVIGPLIAMTSLINDYKETALSVRMLGEIMNREPEGQIGGNRLRPILKGEITFENVTFRYPGASGTALNKANLTIQPGTVVGVVGRSGSGKTTLTKLIQGLYPVAEGVIRFDGIDAREIELSHLRRQVGVVLQENFLFRGTVRENLMMAKPDASFEEVIAAAQASGADEFIERLEKGYDTLLEENAANLSGGQKQRLSIARSLLTKPRILILDEAASALDPESETIFMRNLSRIAVGRTVIMISHRLSTLVNADAILVMHNGQLMDSGTHKELLARSETYLNLWNQQTSHL